MSASNKKTGIPAQTEDVERVDMGIVVAEKSLNIPAAHSAEPQTGYSFGGPVGALVSNLEHQLALQNAAHMRTPIIIHGAIETLSRWSGVMAFFVALGGLIYIVA